MSDAPHITAPPLAPTLAALGGDPRHALNRLHDMAFRFVQFSAAQPGLKPRELDRSARRDLLATMRRMEIEPAGIDLWIPPEHLCSASHVDRAVSALIAAIEMAADLGRVPVSVQLPPKHDESDEAVYTVRAAAHRHGVPLADHAVFTTNDARHEHDEFFGIGIDPAAWLASGSDPANIVSGNSTAIIAARLCDISTSGMRFPIGERAASGRLDVQAYKVALSIAGYTRPIALDARQWPEPWTGIAHSRDAWTD